MRECECGCAQSIAHLHVNTRFHPACSARRSLERKRAERKLRLARPARNYVRKEHAERPPRDPRVVQCGTCCDLPWARSERRLDHDLNPIGIRGPDGVVRCRECGASYEAEPAPERGSVIHSSAGTAVRSGALYGYGKKESDRPSRARVAR